jgi:hypothetical protein
MDKMIKVSESTHKGLKIGATNHGLTMKEFLSRLAENNKFGIYFDVGNYSNDVLVSVFMDITEEFNRRKAKLTEEEKENIKAYSNNNIVML